MADALWRFALSLTPGDRPAPPASTATPASPTWRQPPQMMAMGSPSTTNGEAVSSTGTVSAPGSVESTASSNGHTPSSGSAAVPAAIGWRQRRLRLVMDTEAVDKRALADAVWAGVPDDENRCEVWQLLLGYRPLARLRREGAVANKRREYAALRHELYDASPAAQALRKGEWDTAGGEGELLTQIRKDLPRMQMRSSARCTLDPLIDDVRVRSLMERVLFVWAVRQPAAGYVQGINDVLLPLLLVFLADCAGVSPVEELDMQAVDALSPERLGEVEADCYWCLVKILNEVADHYTDGQPGLQRAVQKLKDLVSRIDVELAAHLEREEADIMTAAFRWIGCLMVRELPVPLCLRLWDTLIAESALASAGFASFLIYFCACFLASFSAMLRAASFDEIMVFLQHSPTDGLATREIEVLIGEAYVLQTLFQGAPRHLQTPGEA